MKLSLEVKTALLVILGILFFIFGYNYLKGKNLFEADNTYYTSFDFNGLKTSSPVTIKGNRIGKVTDIKYDFNTGETKVSFTVVEELKFSKNSTIRLYQEGLMGGNAIAIIPANDNGPTATPGDFLKSEVEKTLVESLSKNFSGLSSELDVTLRSADSLMVSLNTILKDDTENGIKSAITELNHTLKGFKNVSYDVSRLIKKNDTSLTSLIDNFKTISADLAVLSSDLKRAQLGETVVKLDSALVNVNTLLSGLNKGDGTIGKLLKDEELYNNLEGASKQLEELLQDVKLNPKRYIHVSVFGKKAKEYDGEENDKKDN